MGRLDVDVSEVRKLVELVETHNLEELTVEDADLSITVRGRAAQPAAPAVVRSEPHGAAPEPALELPAEAELEEVEAPAEFEGDIVDITTSLVGVFYRAPAPDAPNFVEVGDTIEVGSEIGIIEAMKVFSPIPSEVAGEVVDIPAENGKLVQQGDVLVRVRVHEE
ncbi:MAG: acetyl-CoA carboxylase, biotin carboxyl carrier protein [Armatimonadetes bacterium]|nr:acetyl-CoA carboxylase, biotin carboxyl carrier protein [Armatimonadota bacterium]